MTIHRHVANGETDHADTPEKQASETGFTIRVDKELEDLIPEFLTMTGQDTEILTRALESRDFDKIRQVGHNLKGSGGGYGFDELSLLGHAIEIAAIEKKEGDVRSRLNEVVCYLKHLTVVYK